MLKQAEAALIVNPQPRLLVGSLGHLSIFLWAVGVVMLLPASRGIFAAAIVVIVLGGCYPAAIRRLLKLRWIVVLISLFLMNIFFGVPAGGANWALAGFSISSAAVLSGVQMTIRAIVILLAADGLAGFVNIIEVAGLLERTGFHGLGFSIGVAANLLPDLRRSGAQAWHSLRMRGGLRAQAWRGLQLLLLTILANTLRHADEIVLAAEVRAFRPELCRKVTVRIGSLDWWLALAGGASLAAAILIA